MYSDLWLWQMIIAYIQFLFIIFPMNRKVWLLTNLYSLLYIIYYHFRWSYILLYKTCLIYPFVHNTFGFDAESCTNIHTFRIDVCPCQHQNSCIFLITQLRITFLKILKFTIILLNWYYLSFCYVTIYRFTLALA